MNVPYADFRGVGTERRCAQVPDLAPSIKSDRKCADYNWHASLTPTGAPALARLGDALRIELPLLVKGQAGLNGDLASILSLSGKNFEVQARPGLDVRADLDQRWCPVIAVTPTNNWVSSASVEMVGRNCIGVDLGPLGHPQVCAGPVNVDVTGPVNDKLSGPRDEMAAKVRDALSCDVVRKTVEPQWRGWSVPFRTGAGQQLFLSVTPTGAAFSGLAVEDDAIRATVTLTARTVIGESEIHAESLPLPELKRTDDASSRLSVLLESNVSYETIARELREALQGQAFEQETAAGTVVVRVDDITMYPSGGGLAVGLKVSAKTPAQWFDTRGWVYLVGQPRVQEEGRGIRIENLRYATVLDSAFWQATSSVFEGRVLAALRSHSSIDLSKVLQESASKVSEGVASAQIPGVALTAETPSIRLVGIGLGQESLQAVGSIAMRFAVTLKP